MAALFPHPFVTSLPAGAGMGAARQAAANRTDLPRGH
jgi:hypothetical protein